ncbi:hypothetical protein [uncultured Mobiluncus sp.]|uniref:hypothetical protein n=1 Tax=uncultured Mobiluncus sp. TaxID=293425 RepID=UPI00263A307F|nr:hypothetical protein [uncultured Mobiluncus sp.]
MKKTMIAVVATVALMLTGCASTDIPKTKAAGDGPKPTATMERPDKLAPKSLVPSPDKPLEIGEMQQLPVDETGLVRADLVVPDRWKDYVSITDILGEKEAQKLVDDAVDTARIPVASLYDNWDIVYLRTFPANMVMVPKSENISANEIRERLIPAWKEYLTRKEVMSEFRSSMPRTASFEEHLKAFKTIWKPEGEALAMINDIESGKVENPFTYARKWFSDGDKPDATELNKKLLETFMQMGHMVPVLTDEYASTGACGINVEKPKPDCQFLESTLFVNKPTILFSSHPGYPDGVTIGSMTPNLWTDSDGGISFLQETYPVTLTPQEVNGKTRWVFDKIKNTDNDKTVTLPDGGSHILVDGFY